MKKKVSLLLAVSLVSTVCANFAFAAGLNVEKDSAVILKNNMKSGATAAVIGSVYSAYGDVDFGGGISLVDGNIVYNKSNELIVPQYQPVKINGEVKAVDETSFDYEIGDVDINKGDIGIFDAKDYDVIENLNVANWQPNKEYTITGDTYFKDYLSLNGPLTIDTTAGDVYVKIDNIYMSNTSDDNNSGIINVVGGNKAYILINSSGDFQLFLNSDISYSGNERITQYLDNDKVDLYINTNGNSAGLHSNSVVSANVFAFEGTDGKQPSTFAVNGMIKGDIYSELDNFSLTADGRAEIRGDVYALCGDSKTGVFTVSNDIIGDIVTDMSEFKVTGGDSRVVGVVYAPYAAAQVLSNSYCAEDDADIIGQLVADSLLITGTGKIMYDKAVVDDFDIDDKEPEPTVTVEPAPSSEPAAEPSSEPTPSGEPTATVEPEQTKEPGYVDLIPNNDIPDGPIKRLTSDSAYLYGYTDNWVGADMPIKRQEVAALVNRLLVQNDARDDYSKPENNSYSDLGTDTWSYSALEYMTHIGVYNSNDGTGEQRKVSPDVEVTRGEVAKVVAFSLRLPYVEGELDFEDITPEHKYFKYIKALVDENLLKGSDGRINPDDYMTRAEFVTMFNRIIGRTEENGYIVTVDDCPFVYNNDDTELFVPKGTLDENGDDIGHWAFYEITRAACSFTNKKVDPDKKLDRAWLDQQ